MKRFLSVTVFFLFLAGFGDLGAQKWAVKTNLLYDATATFHAGVEAALTPNMTLDISGNYNPWTWRENRKWKHWMLQPELRWWTCNRFSGHFFGLHALVGQYNFGGISNRINFLGSDLSRLSDNRYEGWGFGAGLAYGYALPLSRHWNIDFELGAGGIWTRFDEFDCSVCNNRTAQDMNHMYWGLTKLALGIVYLF